MQQYPRACRQPPAVANNSCYAGNWNGRIESIGNGGESGSVSSVTAATNTGFVGASSDDGHSTNWCNATNPSTGQQNGMTGCGTAGGSDSRESRDRQSEYHRHERFHRHRWNQTKWAQTLAEYYYGSNFPLKRTYWNGCSTGGRQGFDQARIIPAVRRHPRWRSGVQLEPIPYRGNLSVWRLAGLDPADCSGGVAASRYRGGCNAGVTTALTSAVTSANAQAVSACDTLGLQGLGNDIVADGVINEPRYCTFDATTLVGQTAHR